MRPNVGEIVTVCRMWEGQEEDLDIAPVVSNDGSVICLGGRWDTNRFGPDGKELIPSDSDIRPYHIRCG